MERATDLHVFYEGRLRFEVDRPIDHIKNFTPDELREVLKSMQRYASKNIPISLVRVTGGQATSFPDSAHRDHFRISTKGERVTNIDVRIGPKDSTEPLFPEIEHALCAPVSAVGIIEAGTSQGKTAISLIGRLDDGNQVMIELTAAAFLTIAGALKGAMERFGDDTKGYP